MLKADFHINFYISNLNVHIVNKLLLQKIAQKKFNLKKALTDNTFLINSFI